MIVIANSTIFIGLAKIGKLHLLQKIFSKVYIPKEVHKELTLKGQNKPGSHITLFSLKLIYAKKLL